MKADQLSECALLLSADQCTQLTLDWHSIVLHTDDVTKFNPQCDSHKQTIPWGLRATYETVMLENYSAINFAIQWPLYLKMLTKTHDMYLGIMKIWSLEEGSKI